MLNTVATIFVLYANIYLKYFRMFYKKAKK